DLGPEHGGRGQRRRGRRYQDLTRGRRRHLPVTSSRGTTSAGRPEGRSALARTLARTPIWFLVPSIGLLAGFVIYPMIVLVRMSLSDVGPTNIVGDWPFVGLANFT